MPQHKRTQYQIIAPPPSPAAIPQRNEATSHQPWSEPVRQKIAPALAVALVASGAFAPVLMPSPEVAFASGSWGQPPQANRLFQYQAVAFPTPLQIVTQDKWFSHLSIPVRVAPNIGAARQPFYFAEPFSQTRPETVTEDRWHQAWSEPVRTPARLRAGLEPAQAFSNIFPQSPSFIQPFSTPVRYPPNIGAARQPFYFAEPFSQTRPETVTEDRWHQAWSEPVRFKPGLQASLQEFLKYHPTPISSEIIYEDKWHQGLSVPVRYAPNVGAARQPFYFAEPFGQTRPESVTEDRWHRPWSEPVRFKPDLGAARQPYLFAPSAYVIIATVTVTLGVAESGDVFAGTLQDATSFTQAVVSITEIVPKYANVSSAYVTATFANVSIIEIEA